MPYKTTLAIYKAIKKYKCTLCACDTITIYVTWDWSQYNVKGY